MYYKLQDLTIWNDPLKHQWAVAIFNSCIENGMPKAAAYSVVCRTVKHPHLNMRHEHAPALEREDGKTMDQ